MPLLDPENCMLDLWANPFLFLFIYFLFFIFLQSHWYTGDLARHQNAISPVIYRQIKGELQLRLNIILTNILIHRIFKQMRWMAWFNKDIN